ncbi:hypothetical protein Y023_5404 [Burkholderia pseudomallei A79D]|nr:hypothetical protein Y023_5404 [Burkholderia pseudomallei A79D]KGX96173.1 hypothetical protein X997_5189 [Burkholderia pseudomallei A79C]
MRHLVVRAAQLEREHRLVVLALQVDGVAQPRGQAARAFERRLARDVVHARVQDQLQVIVERARARRDRRGRDGFAEGRFGGFRDDVV